MPASITLTVANLPASTSFFLACLQPLSYVYRGRVENTVGFGLPDAAPDFWITQSIPGVPPGPAHVAFPATSREIVHDFFIAAIKAGARCHGEPALRDVQSGYYSAAVIDLDNNSIEAVYRPDLMEPERWHTADARSRVSQAQKSVAKSKVPSEVSEVAHTKSAVPSRVMTDAQSGSPRSTTSYARSTAEGSRVSKTSNAAPVRAPASTPAPASSQSSGGMISDFLAEAKGTINVARELVGSVNSNKTKAATSTDSHAPSDAIVGTLLGVAAGAALHYAFTNRSKSQDHDSFHEPAHDLSRHPGLARSETAPSYTQQRYNYYHDYENSRPRLALEAAPSAYSRPSDRLLIEMVDNDPRMSDYVPSTVRPGRRNSFSGPVPSYLPSVHTTTTTTTMRRKLLEAPPPTSYRAPTAITHPDGRSQASRRSSRSRSSSLSRAQARTSASPLTRQDEGYASASESRSRVSRRSVSTVKPDTNSRSVTSSRRSSVDRSLPMRQDNGTGSGSGSIMGSVVTAIKNHIEPPRAAYPAEDDRQSFHSTRTSTSKSTSAKSRHSTSSRKSHSHANSKTGTDRQDGDGPRTETVVIGRLTHAQLEKLSDTGGRPRSDITKSVIGKVKDIDNLDVSNREVGPEDSVSQVSSNPSRVSSRKSAHQRR